ncbi:MAG: hypothetical protein JSS01_03670 [Proteobacteria bacterium]|nr:hypothetical protein [Pseudomonadota bacterium]
MARFEAPDVSGRLQEILDALQVLAHSPLMGRPVRGGKRELVVERGVHGYAVLYRYLAEIDNYSCSRCGRSANRASSIKH